MSGMVTALYEALGVDEVLAPGVYAASSDSPAYGDLKALELLGEATYLGDGFSQDGRPAILMRVGGVQKNASGSDEWEFVAQPPNYYSRNKKNYADWRTAWGRECIQNSVDAGARRIVLDHRWLDEARQPCDPRWAKFVEVSCEDDGSGMDERVLRLFVGEAAASVKFGDDAAGGFGKAKEILLWAHVSYTVQSRELVAFGEGNRFKIKRASEVGLAPIRGTRVSTVMAVGDATLAEKAIATIQYSSLPKVTFVVCGAEMKARCAKGREIETQINSRDGQPAMRLFYTKERQDFDRPAILVRDRSGLFMFEVFAPEGFKGVLVVELVQKSVDLLTENRDGLKKELSDQLYRFTSALAADVRSKLREKKKEFRQAYRSIGKGRSNERAQATRAAMTLALGSFDPGGVGEIGFSAEQKETILRALRGQQVPDSFVEQGLGDESAGDGGGSLEAMTVEGGELGDIPVRLVEMDLRAPAEVVRIHLSAGVRDAKHVEQAIRLMAEEPDFVITNRWEDWKPGSKFEPHLMSGEVLHLARFWKELVRWVLIQLGSSVSFNVGFGFDESFLAYCASPADPRKPHIIVLNPFKALSPTGPMYDLSNDDDVKSLFATAVHECVHAAAGCNLHSEDFASAFTRYVAKTAGQWDVIEKLRKAATSRGTSEQRKAARERKAAVAKADRQARRPKAAKYDYISYPSAYSDRDHYGSVVKPGKPGEKTHVVWEETGETAWLADHEFVVEKRYADVPIKYKVGDILRRDAVDYVVESVHRTWAARDGHEKVTARRVRGGALWSFDGIYPIIERDGPGGKPGPEKTQEAWELEPGQQMTWEIADYRQWFNDLADFVVEPPVRFTIRRDEATHNYFVSLPILVVPPSAAVAYDRQSGEVQVDATHLRALCKVRGKGTNERLAEFRVGDWVSVYQRANYLGASVTSNVGIRRKGLVAEVIATPSGNWAYGLAFPKTAISDFGDTLSPIPYGIFFEFCVTPSESGVMSLFSDSEKKMIETLREKGRTDLVDRMMQAVLKERLAWPENRK